MFPALWRGIVVVGDSEGAFCRRQAIGEHVAAYGGFQRARQCLEYALNLVVLVVAASRDVKVHAGAVAEALEEVHEHLGGDVAYLLALEFDVPHKPAAPAEVESHGAQAVVHRQHEAVALDSELVAEGCAQCVTEGYCRVLNGVVLINPQIAFGSYFEVDARVAADLVEYMVEKSQTGGYFARP